MGRKASYVLQWRLGMRTKVSGCCRWASLGASPVRTHLFVAALHTPRSLVGGASCFLLDDDYSSCYTKTYRMGNARGFVIP